MKPVVKSPTATSPYLDSKVVLRIKKSMKMTFSQETRPTERVVHSTFGQQLLRKFQFLSTLGSSYSAHLITHLCFPLFFASRLTIKICSHNSEGLLADRKYRPKPKYGVFDPDYKVCSTNLPQDKYPSTTVKFCIVEVESFNVRCLQRERIVDGHGHSIFKDTFPQVFHC